MPKIYDSIKYNLATSSIIFGNYTIETLMPYNYKQNTCFYCDEDIDVSNYDDLTIDKNHHYHTNNNDTIIKIINDNDICFNFNNNLCGMLWYTKMCVIRPMKTFVGVSFGNWHDSIVNRMFIKKDAFMSLLEDFVKFMNSDITVGSNFIIKTYETENECTNDHYIAYDFIKNNEIINHGSYEYDNIVERILGDYPSFIFEPD